jgi:3'-phosphoadenosine 5'-phosphosulfate sulfotransferase (PAPS reductase)/FAD synthetase
MALRLAEVEPRAYKFVCTPTGDELPEMVAHWDRVEKLLGQELIRLQVDTLEGLIVKQNALPNWRQRWCTRMLKLEPYGEVLASLAKLGPVTSYVGLRADEPLREGGVFVRVPEVTIRFPLREWGWGLKEVRGYLDEKGICIPKRTDCGLCFFQRLGEWYDLWKEYPDRWAKGEEYEAMTGYTFRSPGRDTWPASMAELRAEFERGRIPRDRKDVQGGLFEETKCRACSL